MSWLQKNVGNMISGGNKFLHKSINNGSSYLGKFNQLVGSVKDKYAQSKQSLLDNIGQYNPKLKDLAREGIGMLENKAMDFINPLGVEAKPLMDLGMSLGKTLKNY